VLSVYKSADSRLLSQFVSSVHSTLEDIMTYPLDDSQKWEAAYLALKIESGFASEYPLNDDPQLSTISTFLLAEGQRITNNWSPWLSQPCNEPPGRIMVMRFTTKRSSDGSV
jgi:hypothetical protein